MGDHKKPSAKGRKKWPTSSKEPVVFHFRPVEYQVVPPERFRAWQQAMIESVGLPREVVERMKYTGHEVETISNGAWDD